MRGNETPPLHAPLIHISGYASGFYHLKRLRQARNCVSRDVMTQLVISRLDYCNSVFSGLPVSSLAPLYNVYYRTRLLD